MALSTPQFSRLIFAVIAAFLLTVGIVVGITEASTSAPQSTNNDDLLVLSAQAGTFTEEAEDRTTLNLTGVQTSALWFTDRPIRQAGSLPTSTLINDWSRYFATSEPNAAGVFDRTSAGSSVNSPVPLVLSQPTLTSSGVSFLVSPIGEGSWPASGTDLEGVRVFIDPPTARLTDFRESPMLTPTGPVQIPNISSPTMPTFPALNVSDNPPVTIANRLIIIGPPPQ